MAYKILSLSGGGIRGVFQAEYLRRLEEQLPKPLSKNFDLVAGTSTGAIVAMAVAMDLELARVVDLFKHQGKKIFRGRWFSSVRKGPRYDAKPLRESLQSVLGAKTLRQCKLPIVIPVTTLNKFGHKTITTWGTEDLDLSVVDVVLASCAAPTFFGPVKPVGQESTYVDGGMWANNPSLIAATEAYARKNISFAEMKILSIGNGVRPGGARVAAYSTLRTISPRMIGYILDMVFATQSDMGSAVVSALVGSKRYMSINTTLPCVIELDNVNKALEILPALANNEANGTLRDVQAFLRDDAEPSP